MSQIKSIYCIVLVAMTSFLSACTEEVENEYSGYRAFFRYPLVVTTQPLRTALDNPGMFCTIHYDARHYYFRSPDGMSATQTRTALDNYGAPISIAGFVVGTPTIPSLHNGLHEAVAYDLVCPSCFTYDAIERKLDFSADDASGTKMACGRCSRIYDLNNSGIPISGPTPAHKMFRYRMSYAAAQGTLVIQN